MNMGEKVCIIKSHEGAVSFVGHSGIIYGFKDDQILVRINLGENKMERIYPFWRDELEDMKESI